MKVSIVTAVYNNNLTIDKVINSVASQSYPDIEYIVIDGNSNDGTLDILKARKDDIHILISEPDKGIYDAMNKGIKQATGDIIGIINSDDFFYDNNVIERVVESFKLDSSVQAVYSNIVFINNHVEQKTIRYYSSQLFRPWMFRFGFQPAHPTFYVKREVFDQYGFYRTDLKIAGDFELLLRFLVKYKIKYKYIKDVWVKMRIGGVSTSGINSIIRLNSEVLYACKCNNIYSNYIMIYLKYLIKWSGFLVKFI